MTDNLRIFKGPGKAYNAKGEHIGPGEWLDVVHDINGIEPETFGVPMLEESVEHYPAFDIVHVTSEEAVLIVPKTEAAQELLNRAMELRSPGWSG